jgi:hypothetical protein
MHTSTVAVYDLYVAAYLRALDISLIDVRYDAGQVRFEYDNHEHRAELAVAEFQNGNPTLSVRAVLNAYKAIKSRMWQARAEARVA